MAQTNRRISQCLHHRCVHKAHDKIHLQKYFYIKALIVQKKLVSLMVSPTVIVYFLEYKSLVENQSTKKIKCIRMDNGGEYIIHSLAKICKQAGIRHQTTFPYSPQQNGLAERMNKTITERATSMNHHMHVDQKWCVEAMNTAAYITNRLSSASHPDKTSFQICLGHRPNVEGMRVFRVFGNPHIDKYSRKKLEKKTFPCMFLAYSDDVKGYNVWILNANRLQLTRSAQFQEIPQL